MAPPVLAAPTGGSITYTATNLTKTNSTLSLTVNDGTDTTNGINVASRLLTRREAAMDSEGVCSTTYSNYYPVTFSGTYPNLTTSNFEIAKCYQYQWLVFDTLGNQTIYTSSTIVTTIPETLSFQTLPLGAIISVNDILFTKANTDDLLLSLNNFPDSFSTTFYYTGSAQPYTVPQTGWYQVEAWGGQGGGSAGGQGGYNSGLIYLNRGDTYYFYVGGNTSTFNGGGTPYISTAGYGGGATDMRLVNGDWNNTTSLASRIIVAGGGGGNTRYNAGYGGNLVAGKAYDSAYAAYIAYGGTQVSGGTVVNYNSSYSEGTAGQFGIGGDGGGAQNSGSSGGGGGYYGGGGGSRLSSGSWPGGGGSSFISGYAGVNAITSSSSTTATNQTLHYSHKYFIDGTMQAGVRSGNGQAKITFIPQPKRINPALDNVRYIKDCASGSTANVNNHWVELQALKNGVNVAKNLSATFTTSVNNASYPISNLTNGDITSANYAEGGIGDTNGQQCVTIDLGQTYDLDEIAIWHYWADGRTYYNNYTLVSANNATWTTVLNESAPETANGKRVSAYRLLDVCAIENTPAAPTVVNTPSCGSSTLTASGSGGTLYYQGTNPSGTSTADTATSKSFTATATTRYYWRILSSNGCWSAAASASPTIYAIPAAVTVTPGALSSGVCGTKTMTASGGSGGTIYYQGTTTNGTSTTTASSSQSVSTIGTYYFRSRSTNGCWGPQGSAATGTFYPCMQSWNSCSAYATPASNGATSIGYLTDSRDGKSYEIRKFADGKCWMVTNLKYGGATDACASKTTFASAGSATASNRFGSGTYGDCRSDPADASYGYLYNWQAAMQHSSAYLLANYTGPTSNVQGLCPTGWHLPTGGPSGEQVVLDKAVGGTGAKQTSGNAFVFWRPGGNWKGVYSGFCYANGTLGNQGTYGYYWSSTQSDTENSYILYFNTTGVYPQIALSKDHGFAIRCIKN